MVDSIRIPSFRSALGCRVVMAAMLLALALSLSCKRSRPVEPLLPVITVHPPSLAFTVTAGGQIPPSQRITINNAGSGTLDFTVTKKTSWLQLYFSGKAPDTVEVFVYPSGLATGTHWDTVTITSRTASNSPQRVAVTITVLSGISVSPELVSRTAYRNGPALEPETLEVRSEGGGPKIYKIATPPSWLKVDYPVGVATEKIAVRFEHQNLQSGRYGHQLTIMSNEASNRTTQATCSLVVESWRTRFEQNSHVIRRFASSSAIHGWAAGELHTIDGLVASLFRTIDGGLTWKLINLPAMTGLSDLFIADDGRLWMPGDSGKLLSGTIGSFLEESLATQKRLTGIAFSSSDTAWITGENGTLFRSIDGGANWVLRGVPTFVSLNAIAFLDSQHGWIAGNDGLVLITSDGGDNWQAHTPGPKTILRDVAISQAGSTWVVGSAGTILFRSWVGINWTLVQSGVTEDLKEIAFSDPDNGWIVGSNGLVLRTSDGGVTWHRQTTGTVQQLNTLWVKDANRVFVGGIDAVILDTYSGGE